jgi:hypothetical protein
LARPSFTTRRVIQRLKPLLGAVMSKLKPSASIV